MNKAGIIGVGNMGGGMAGRLLELGWQVGVHDVDAARELVYASKGAGVHASGASLASKFVAIIICVVDAAQTEDVLFGAQGVAATVRAGHTVMLCPTIAPQDTERFAARLAQQARGICAKVGGCDYFMSSRWRSRQMCWRRCSRTS